MDEFIRIVSSFPTVVFSAMLVLALIYWLFVILGALDLDLFDFDIEGVDFEIDLDVDLDVDADLDLDADVEAHSMPVWMSLLTFSGIGKVPFMIVASSVVLASFVFSYLIVAIAGPYLAVTALTGVLIMMLSLLLSYPTTAIAMHPLKDVFRVERVEGGAALVGQTCVITTGSVKETFGQAKIDQDGAGLLLSVRADSPNDLKKGKKALIVDFDGEQNTFWVEPYASFEFDEEQQEAHSEESVQEHNRRRA